MKKIILLGIIVILGASAIALFYNSNNLSDALDETFGAMPKTRTEMGGTYQDSSAWTGIVRTDSGVWSATTTLGVSAIDTDTLTVNNTFTLGGVVGTGGLDLNGEQLILDPDGGMYMQASTNDLLGIMGGNVGIGTASPTEKLHIKIEADGGVRIQAGHNDHAMVEFSGENDDDKWVLGYQDYTGYFNIGEDSALLVQLIFLVASK